MPYNCWEVIYKDTGAKFHRAVSDAIAGNNGHIGIGRFMLGVKKMFSLDNAGQEQVVHGGYGISIFGRFHVWLDQATSHPVLAIALLQADV